MYCIYEDVFAKMVLAQVVLPLRRKPGDVAASQRNRSRGLQPRLAATRLVMAVLGGAL